MANSINNCVFTGNLGADPNFQVTSNGNPMATLNLAVTNYDFGQKAETTMWLRVTLFGQKAEFAEKFASKGDKVGVVGSLRVREYTDRDDNPQKSVELLANDFQILHSVKAPAQQASRKSSNEDEFDPFLDDEEEEIVQEKAKAQNRRASSSASSRSRSRR